jgi:oligoribonuclease NrnB/cAMP/cGMP phosphodiesterase (DHH superfamily)
MNKATIVYHQAKPGTDCPDGICAAWITARALGLGKPCNLVPQIHLRNEEYDGYELPFPLEGDIYLVDFAYPEHLLKEIASQANFLAVIDHHKDKIHVPRLLAENNGIYGIFDIAECGATAAWKYFHGDGIAGRISMPWFLPYVRQRDIGANGYYQGEIPESEAIGEAMSRRRHKYGIGEAAFAFFDELVKTSKQDLIAEGMPAITERDVQIARYLGELSYNFNLMTVGEFEVPYFNLVDRLHLHRHYSMVGAKAAIQYYDYPFVAVSCDGVNISLRSRRNGGADVSIIANSLGGGGHEHAAGYKLK